MTMDIEPTDDLQARRLQSIFSDLPPAWTPAELCALLLDLSEGSDQGSQSLCAAESSAQRLPE
jgi:hypothetical protein